MISFLLSFLLMTSNVPQSAYTSDVSTVSHRAAADFLPDGDLSKAAWKDAARVSFEHNYTGDNRYPELKTEVASLWTEKYVYFAFWCKYSKLNVYQGEDPAHERWQLWDRDVVEVFINPNPENVNHYYE